MTTATARPLLCVVVAYQGACSSVGYAGSQVVYATTRWPRLCTAPRAAQQPTLCACAASSACCCSSCCRKDSRDASAAATLASLASSCCTCRCRAARCSCSADCSPCTADLLLSRTSRSPCSRGDIDHLTHTVACTRDLHMATQAWTAPCQAMQHSSHSFLLASVHALMVGVLSNHQ